MQVRLWPVIVNLGISSLLLLVMNFRDYILVFGILLSISDIFTLIFYFITFKTVLGRIIVQHNTILYYTIQYSAIQYYTMQMQHDIIKYNAIEY